MNILVVEDDTDLVDLIEFTLTRAGFAVDHTADLVRSRSLIRQSWPDLVLLDLNLGSWQGLDLLREIRPATHLPVIILTANDSEDDKVRGLDAGANDYITKPFSHRELVARINAHLRRDAQTPLAPTTPSELRTIEAGPIVLNVAEHSAAKNGQPLRLTLTEFRLLHYLMVRAGTVIPATELLEQIWGYTDSAGTDVIRVAVRRLRQKIEEDPTQPDLLRTIQGLGVMFKS